ncbi:hypothetical protein CDD82_1933 [Ophiocordyceps australis]|uniref:DUF7582 domain-containing protein n=1 Tax=Ophiocordyceps australis TaxID=1399860 RepID=A0A2C5ZJY0_9HYPO|nr:hypothetical protein CDD82_1933 [Ophiocordyceps australis]
MPLKDKTISSPLEAGPSILDTHHVPPRTLAALDYVARRLTRRGLHLSLVLVRSHHQLPAHGSPGITGQAGLQRSTSVSMPGPRLAALKQLVRTGSLRSSRDKMPTSSPWPVAKRHETATSSWPSSPSSPPPLTPSTGSSATESSGDAFGVRLLHGPELGSRRRRILASVLAKAQDKFGSTESPWLAPAVSPTTCGLSNHLFHSSVAQHEVLFKADGLTLLSLDRLYGLKAALASYSRTRCPLRLEDAVDELRRFVLCAGGSSCNTIKVSRAYLVRSYDWLSVSNAAVADLDRVYRRAYGGPRQLGAISGMPHHDEAAANLPTLLQEPIMVTPVQGLPHELPGAWELRPDMIGIALTTPEQYKLSPSRHAPPLRLETASRPKDRDWDHDWEHEPEAKAALTTAYNASYSMARTRRPEPSTLHGYSATDPNVAHGEWAFLMAASAPKHNKSAVMTRHY